MTPLVEVRGVVGTSFRNLTFTGGSSGIHVRHATAFIRDCEFRGNRNGILSESSQTHIFSSLFTDNFTGVQSLQADFIALDDSTVVNNEQTGVFVSSGSRLLMDGGEVSGNLFGIKLLDNSSAFLRQPLVVGDTTGGSHMDAVNHSTLTINDGVVVTGSNDIEIVKPAQYFQVADSSLRNR